MTETRSTITMTDLRAVVGDGTVTIVDIRTAAAYNGWRRGSVARGGHIPGSISFPSGWLDTIEDVAVARWLAANGVSPERQIVVCGDGDDDAETFAAELRARGLARVQTLEGGAAAWSADRSLPLERLPNHHVLVDAPWLRDVLEGKRPESAPEGPPCLIEVGFGGLGSYASGHLPGALYLDTERLEDPADWNRRAPIELEAALVALGVSKRRPVVVYGRDGQLAAFRALLLLRYAGVDDVRLLDGGFEAWLRAGFAVETRVATPVAVRPFGAPIPSRPELIVDIGEAKEVLADRAGAALVSVRSWDEQIGNVSGYDYVGPRGRIAGDVWGHGGSDAQHMEHYRNPDGTMRTDPAIAAGWAAVGITPDKRIAFYCGTGWRASEAWFHAYLLGWERIAVYDGGWFEWSRDPAGNPIEVGEPTSGPTGSGPS